MRKIILILFTFALHLQTTFAQQPDPTFHRLLIMNQSDELMIVKIKNSNVWVTPGLYQTHNQTIKEGLDSIASTYGITLTNMELKGVFTLQQKATGVMAIKNYFVTKVDGWGKYYPDILEEVRWLPLKEAYKLLSFPHINLFTKQVMAEPDVLWGGTVLKYKEGKENRGEIIEDFYSLSKK